MNPSVTVVDYGIGNILSVSRALEHCGARVVLSDDFHSVESAERLLLPGVGAFADCIRALKERQLYNSVRAFALTGKPFLGICVGMQMLFDESEEFGQHQGLEIIPGRVVKIPADTDGELRKVPHVGWAALGPSQTRTSWNGSILSDVAPGESVYFVHSYVARPAQLEHSLADCEYVGERLCAVVQRGAIHGCQFHPEKSGATGLKIISRFLKL